MAGGGSPSIFKVGFGAAGLLQTIDGEGTTQLSALPPDTPRIDDPHTFTVDFANDLYTGLAGTDRNLYLDGTPYNGTTVSGAQAALYRIGPQSFVFHTATTAS